MGSMVKPWNDGGWDGTAIRCPDPPRSPREVPAGQANDGACYPVTSFGSASSGEARLKE